jgi:hypothetical protein
LFRRQCGELASSAIDAISEYMKLYPLDEMCKHSADGVLNVFYFFYGDMNETKAILKEPKTSSFRDYPVDPPFTCPGKPPPLTSVSALLRYS